MTFYGFRAWALAAIVLSAQATVLAQNFTKPIRLIVPYGAGGVTDVLARSVALTLSQELGQPVVVENKPGANGQIGTHFVKTAPADGSVLLFTLDHSVVIVPLVAQGVPYSASDLLPVGKVARFQWVFATPASSSAATLPEFIDQAKKNVDLRQYGVPIIGGTPQIMGEAIAKRTGYPMTMVPFGGAAPLMPLLMGGQISAGVVGAGEAASMKKSGKVRLLAISGEKRSSVMPEVPTFEELGVPGVKLGSLYSVFAPKELPRAMAERVNKALQKSVTAPKVVHLAQESSLELETGSLTEFEREMADIDKFWQGTQSKPSSKQP